MNDQVLARFAHRTKRSTSYEGNFGTANITPKCIQPRAMSFNEYDAHLNKKRLKMFRASLKNRSTNAPKLFAAHSNNTKEKI